MMQSAPLATMIRKDLSDVCQFSRYLNVRKVQENTDFCFIHHNILASRCISGI